MIPLHFQPSTQTVDDYAGDAIRMTQKLYNIDLSAMVPSALRHVDAILAAWRKGGANANQVGKSMYAFGALAGSILLKARSGHWFKPSHEPDETHFYDYPFLAVQLDSGAVWRPINMGFEIIDGMPNASYWQSFVGLLTEAGRA